MLFKCFSLDGLNKNDLETHSCGPNFFSQCRLLEFRWLNVGQSLKTCLKLLQFRVWAKEHPSELIQEEENSLHTQHWNLPVHSHHYLHIYILSLLEYQEEFKGI